MHYERYGRLSTQMNFESILRCNCTYSDRNGDRNAPRKDVPPQLDVPSKDTEQRTS